MVLGGSLLPGKNINNSFADARRNIAEESSLHQIVESKISCSLTLAMQVFKDLQNTR